MKAFTVFVEFHDNGAVMLDAITTGSEEIVIGRNQFMQRMGELYDKHCLSLNDITKERVSP